MNETAENLATVESGAKQAWATYYEFRKHVKTLPVCRELSVALTKLDECRQWLREGGAVGLEDRD